jgi:hypothetical protein
MCVQKSVNPARYQAVFLERLESRRSALRECLTPEEQLTPDRDQRRVPRAGGNRENLLTRVGVETARKLRAESIHRGVPVGQILDDLVAKGLP